MVFTQAVQVMPLVLNQRFILMHPMLMEVHSQHLRLATLFPHGVIAQVMGMISRNQV
jgi:hypothetical protein